LPMAPRASAASCRTMVSWACAAVSIPQGLGEGRGDRRRLA
jgi:hypothetical protein